MQKSMLDFNGLLREGKENIIAIQSPTASGKTTGIIRYLCDTPSLLIVPTKTVADSLIATMHTRIVTAETFLKLSLRNWGTKTVVLDEAHTTTEAYEKVYYMLRYQRPSRLILMSATMDWAKVDLFFPGYKKHDLAKPPAYPITVKYHSDTIPKLLQATWKTDAEKEIALVFLPSTRVCDRVASEILATKSADAVVCRYGGMGSSDLRLFSDSIRNQKGRIVICATNIIESGITIPDVTIVIDTGTVYCKTGAQRLELLTCSKSMVEQRKGRTGRTCAGTVYRTYSRAVYDEMHQTLPVYVDFERFALQLLQKRLPVDSILQDKEPEQLLHNLTEHGCVSQNEITPFGRFLLKGDYTYDTAKMMWSATNHAIETSKDRITLRLFALLIIEAVKTGVRHLFKPSAHDTLSELYTKYGGIDELHTYMNIISTVILTGERHQALNKHMTDHILKTIAKGFKEDDCLRACLVFSTSKNIIRTSCYRWVNDFLLSYIPVTDIVSANLVPDKRLLTFPSHVLPLFVYHVNNVRFLQLFAKGPEFSLRKMKSSIRREVHIRECWRKRNHQLKTALLREIRQDVAYRPGNVEFFRVMQDFYSKSVALNTLFS